MPKKYKKSPIKKAFSLVELSIVILIVSILITGSLGISKTAINNAKIKVTKDRMDTVYKAFNSYLAANRRLPCPASMAVAKGTALTYGAESATPGTCTGAYISSNASNLAYGMVPILALNLDPDMAEDGFGTKFTYVVDRRFTAQSTSATSVSTCTGTTPPSCGFEITKGIASDADTSTTDLSGIDVQGPLGTSLLSNKNGIFLLLSHGPDKYKGFNATGTAQDTTPGVDDENNNSCDQTSLCATTSTASFDRVFINNSTNPNFDDIVMFKSKPQLVRDAGLEFLMCSPSEAQTASLTWTTNGSYGCNVCSGTANNSKTCGKYGVWGSALTNIICTTNNATCSAAGLSRLDGRWRVATQSSNGSDYAISFGTQDLNNLTGYLTKTTSTTTGDFWTINVSGIYSIHWNYITVTMPQLAWIDKNQASTTSYGTIFSNAPGDILALRSHTGFNENSVSWVGYLSVNDIIRFKMSTATPSMENHTAWTVSFVLLQQV
jgi:prepilin-type N-terminal cleavage/methylation domain-containing protein